MKLINFNNSIRRKKGYGGAGGNKLSIVLNDEVYMLKLPSHAKKNPNMSYANSCISEYIGSHIFNLLGITAQDTLLGTFEHNGIERISVACKDFEQNGYMLKDFASIKNQILDSSSNGLGTELNDILETIEQQQIMDPVILSNHFWDMFIVDAIVGNWDRHNGNWGFLYNQETDDVKLAPIYDCGSCLFPQIDENEFKKILKNKSEFNARIYNFPTSSIKLDGKRINYASFIKSHEYKQCDEALNRIKERINFNEIYKLIDEIPCINEDNKEFLKKIIKARFETFVRE